MKILTFLKTAVSYSTKNLNAHEYDVAVVGGGIIGTAIAKTIKEHSEEVKIVVVEKENRLGKHQSSHNSGVIHAGIYYKPGSLKAKFCTSGSELLYGYCKNKKIPFKNGGKLIVATDFDQIDKLNKLYERGKKNGVKDLELICSLEDILKIEPCARGVQALWSPNTGNVDFGVVTENFGDDFQKNGGKILFNKTVNCVKSSLNPEYPILLRCNENFFLMSKYLVLCAGLQSGALSKLIPNAERDKKTFVSFRVDYQLLDKTIPVNIYATPELDMPFLGVHASPLIDQPGTLLGPTAIPAYKLEGYEADEINLSYIKNTLTSTAFRNMIRKYCSHCFDQAAKQFCPELKLKALQKLACIQDGVSDGKVAVQTQLINEDGSFVDDYVFEFFKGCEDVQKRTINCKFLPSPAATSCLAIARYVTEKFLEQVHKK